MTVTLVNRPLMPVDVNGSSVPVLAPDGARVVNIANLTNSQISRYLGDVAVIRVFAIDSPFYVVFSTGLVIPPITADATNGNIFLPQGSVEYFSFKDYTHLACAAVTPGPTTFVNVTVMF